MNGSVKRPAHGLFAYQVIQPVLFCSSRFSCIRADNCSPWGGRCSWVCRPDGIWCRVVLSWSIASARASNPQPVAPSSTPGRRQVGEASDIEYRSVSGIDAYIPLIQVNELTEPLLGIDVNDLPSKWVPRTGTCTSAIWNRRRPTSLVRGVWATGLTLGLRPGRLDWSGPRNASVRCRNDFEYKKKNVTPVVTVRTGKAGWLAQVPHVATRPRGDKGTPSRDRTTPHYASTLPAHVPVVRCLCLDCRCRFLCAFCSAHPYLPLRMGGNYSPGDLSMSSDRDFPFIQKVK